MFRLADRGPSTTNQLRIREADSPLRMTILESAKIVAYSVPKLTDYSAAALDEAVEELLSASDQEWQAVRNESDWKALRDRWMARKNGVLTLVNDLWLKPAPREAKRDVGQRVNRIREQVEKDIERGRGLSKNYPILAQYFSSPAVDITLPGIRHPIGAEHPVVKTTNEMVRVFQRLGYSVADGPVVETDYYNFEALNFPPNHPARDTQDTLFIAGQQGKAQRERLLLRTHTSPVQIRTMEKMRPPIRIVIPGTVHRNDPPDASHSPMFHQIEGLAVDTNITFGDLKGTLDHAMKEFFGSSVKTSFRPSFFPFTEPSAEMYVSCFICGGSGRRGNDPCRPCKQTGWIEILGCGMVDPNVFEFVKDNGYDPKKVSGFAFGMGADR
ncbi:MAG: phenylalanine--tRNA ligase subunit alpha, partial [Candidatus Sulfotelmatobacter sp.]